MGAGEDRVSPVVEGEGGGVEDENTDGFRAPAGLDTWGWERSWYVEC